MGRPQIYDDALRERLLQAAAARVFDHGIASLSLRSLAADAGTTTAAIYTLFGNKAGLHSALYERAIAHFSAELGRVALTTDPTEDVVQLGLAYRRSALADPHGYRIMFGDGSHPLEIDSNLAKRAATTFTSLLDAVRRGVAAGQFVRSPPADAIATSLWAHVHGLVTIELGTLTPPEAGDIGQLAEPAIRAAVRGWAAPTGGQAQATGPRDSA